MHRHEEFRFERLHILKTVRFRLDDDVVRRRVRRQFITALQSSGRKWRRLRSLIRWWCDAETVARADAATRLQCFFEVAVEFINIFRVAQFLEDAGYEILVQVVTVSRVDSGIIQRKDLSR